MVFQRLPLMEDWGWTGRPTLPFSTAVGLSSSNTKLPALLIDSDLRKEDNCEGTVHLEAGPSFQETGKQPCIEVNVQKGQQKCWKLQEKLKTAAEAEPNEGDRKAGRTGRDRANRANPPATQYPDTNMAPNFQCSSVRLSCLVASLDWFLSFWRMLDWLQNCYKCFKIILLHSAIVRNPAASLIVSNFCV